MNRAENEAYWGSTETAPQTLKNFFDEDSDVTWTGLSSSFTPKSPSSPAPAGPVTALAHSLSNTSIQDNITTNATLQEYSASSDGVSGGRLAKGFGKAIGEKFDSFKPPSVSIKWNPSLGTGSSSCLQCSAKDEEISQLKKRLENSYSRYNLTLPPDDTVQRIVLGQPYSLESYRSHLDKCALLDAALATMDGGAVLATTLHMKNTVKRNIFIKELQKRPQAVQVYVHYLKQRHNFTEAIELLGLLGKHEEAAILSYQKAVTSKEPKAKLEGLRKTLQSAFTDAGSHEARMVAEHIQLLERQIVVDQQDSVDQSNAMLIEYPRASSIGDHSLLTTLYYCCMYHWDASESHPASPVALRKAHNIPINQVLWTVIKARARVNHWPLPADLDAWMGNRGLLGALGSLTSVLGGAGKMVKSHLPIEQVVHLLATSKAPNNVLAAYIGLLDSTDTRLKLAVNYKCHQAAIEVFIGQKDRDALEKYMKEVPSGTPEYIKAEHALKTVRWKN